MCLARGVAKEGNARKDKQDATWLDPLKLSPVALPFHAGGNVSLLEIYWFGGNGAGCSLCWVGPVFIICLLLMAHYYSQ